jgi:hypothetical protein
MKIGLNKTDNRPRYDAELPGLENSFLSTVEILGLKLAHL